MAARGDARHDEQARSALEDRKIDPGIRLANHTAELPVRLSDEYVPVTTNAM